MPACINFLGFGELIRIEGVNYKKIKIENLTLIHCLGCFSTAYVYLSWSRYLLGERKQKYLWFRGGKNLIIDLDDYCE